MLLDLRIILIGTEWYGRVKHFLAWLKLGCFVVDNACVWITYAAAYHLGPPLGGPVWRFGGGVALFWFSRYILTRMTVRPFLG